MSEIQLVKQSDPHGCGIAILAMLTGHTYEQVKSAFKGRRWRDNHFATKGMNFIEIESYLAQHGFAVARLALYNPITCRKRIKWPRMLGKVNYAEVRQFSNNLHFIVVLGDGTIFDPLVENNDKQFSDYAEICSVTAVIKI